MPSATDTATELLARFGTADRLEGTGVGALLALSKAAHQTYRHALTVQRDSALARQALENAARYRAEAQSLDNEHTDPAWSEDASTHGGHQISHGEIHDDLLGFYLKELNK